MPAAKVQQIAQTTSADPEDGQSLRGAQNRSRERIGVPLAGSRRAQQGGELVRGDIPGSDARPSGLRAGRMCRGATGARRATLKRMQGCERLARAQAAAARRRRDAHHTVLWQAGEHRGSPRCPPVCQEPPQWFHAGMITVGSPTAIDQLAIGNKRALSLTRSTRTTRVPREASLRGFPGRSVTDGRPTTRHGMDLHGDVEGGWECSYMRLRRLLE